MKVHIAVIAVLSLLLFFLLNSATQDGVGELTQSEIALRQDYDYFMAEVDSTRFGADGAPRYRIRATRITHYPDPEYAVMDTPRFTIYQSESAPWFISADNGRTDTDPLRNEDRVELMDNVVIQRTDGEGRPLNIYTEFLTVYPDSRSVSTDLDVRIESSDSRLSSTGMRADLDTNEVQLLANVRGSYE